MGYSSLGQGVEYNSEDVRGVNSNWITSHKFTDVANPYYPDARRYDDIADKVSVPPNSQVDVGMWIWNYASHDIYVNSADIFTSRQNPVDGDITRLGASGEYSSSCWNTNGGQDCRSGKKVSTPIQSTYSYHGNDLGKILYSFNTIQPIQLEKITPEYFFEGVNLNVKYILTLKNVSSYNLCNININHNLPNGETHNENVCLNANSSLTVTYNANLGTNYPLTISNGSIKITDPNRHTEIVASSNTSSSSDFRSIVVWRDDKDHNSPAGVYGAQPGWGNTKGTFGVELIPYSFNINVPNTNLYSKVQSSETITNLTSIENGRVDSSELNFLPGDKIQYVYKIKNVGTSKTNVNFIYQLEKDNKIYELEILSNEINDSKSTVSSNSQSDKEEINVSIPEFNVGEEREIKIVAKVKNVNFRSKFYELENYEGEMNLAKTLNSNVKITDQNSSDELGHNSALTMKIANIEVNLESNKKEYDNYDKPEYRIEYKNNSSYKVTIWPNLITSGQVPVYSELGEAEYVKFDYKYLIQTEFQDVIDQMAHFHMYTEYFDENNNNYNYLYNYIPVKVNDPNIKVTKNISGGLFYTIGDKVGFEIIIKNEGEGTAKDVTLSDILNDSWITDLSEFDPINKTITWNLGNIFSGESRVIKYILEVNRDKIFVNGEELSNSVSVKASNEPNEKTASSKANLECAKVQGLAWEDNNKNQIVDSGEKLLSNQLAKVIVNWNNEENSETSTYNFVTDSNGFFVLNCVPYKKIIKVRFTMPKEYFSSSSPIEYSFIFKNNLLNQGNLSELESLIESTNSELVDNNKKEVLLGLYNEEKKAEIEKVLATTGEETIYGLLSSALFLLPISLLILKRFKFGKFIKKRLTQHQ